MANKKSENEMKKNASVKSTKQAKSKNINQTQKKKTGSKTEEKKSVNPSKTSPTAKESKKEKVEKERVTNKTVKNSETVKTNSKKQLEEKKVEPKTKNIQKDAPALIASDEMSKLIRIILIVVIVAVAFYGITMIVMKFQKESIPERKVDNTPAVIQYEEILIGTMLNQKRNEYYVLIQKADDPYQSLTKYYIQKYQAKKDSLKVYRADMNQALNALYISETSNIKASSIHDFKISDITLVKVKNKRIVEAYEGIGAIEKALQTISTTK